MKFSIQFLVFCLCLACSAARGQVASGFSNGPTNLAAVENLTGPEKIGMPLIENLTGGTPVPLIDPASAPADTNDYVETLQLTWPAIVSPSGVPAAQYHVELETNGFARCGDYFTTTNRLAVTLPSTNQYRVACILPEDVDGNFIFVNQDLSGLVVQPVPPTMVTIEWLSAPATLQVSSDLVNWSTIAAGLMETNLTYAIDRAQNQFWRTVPAQPLTINAHY